MKPPSSTLKYLSHRDELGAHLTAAGLTGKAVEVGTLYGSYAAILLRSWPGHLYCVDPWVNQNQSVYFDGANKADMRRIWEDVQRNVGSNPRCTLMRMMSLEGADKFEDESLVACYLDANHSLEAARGDIHAWFSKVKIGGIFAGHDFFCRYDKDTNSDAQTAVMEFAERVGQWPHVTWCTSWFFVKTQEMVDRYHGRPIPVRMPIDRTQTPVVAVLAVSHVDFHLAKKWLRWAAIVSEDTKPDERHQLIVFGSKALEEQHWEELREAANGIQPAPAFRATPELYERGYGASANYTFRTALECVEREYPGHAMIWCEADTTPMGPGWMTKIRDEYRGCGKPFLGDFYEHPKGVAGIDHMTGTAVYGPDWREAAPSLALLPEPRPAEGWDTLCAHETVPQMERSSTIQQTWRPPLPITRRWAQDNIGEEVALFHQCKDGSLIDVLCEGSGANKIPLSEPLPKYVPAAPEIENKGGGTAIVIVSCRRDIDLLQYCLRSIQRYATGFLGVWLVVPEKDRKEFHFAEGMPGVTLVGFNERPDKAFLHHEIMICRADEICRDAAHILFLDSDCSFWQPVTPEHYVANGKCRMVRERYEDIGKRNPNRLIWRACVERAAGITPEWEGMTMHPLIYPRALFARMRQLVEAHTGQDFDSYVFSCENGFPQGWAEHPTLAAIGIRDMPHLFDFVHYDHERDRQECGISPDVAFQALYRPGRDALVETWSHSGLARYKNDLDKFYAGKLPAYYLK